MDRYAVFVDAGYFFAAGAYSIAGTNVQRRSISLDNPQATIQALCERASNQTTVANLLRVYWYDALTGPHPSLEQSTLAHLAGVKLRLGSLNSAGEQKGVDSLIVTDLIELARNRAITDVVLVSGDEDLRIAVQLAQTYGVRVHVLAVGDAERNVSATLRMEADSLQGLGVSWLQAHLRILPQRVQAPIEPAREADAVAPQTLDDAAMSVSQGLLDEVDEEAKRNLLAHFTTSHTVPPEFDRKLIARTAKALGRQLTSLEMRKIRGCFVTRVREIVPK